MLNLVVGLGNLSLKGSTSPYCQTRHNTGSDFILQVADYHKAKWNHQKSLKCALARVGEHYLGLTGDWINDSGRPIKNMLQILNISYKDLIIITDDVELQYGEFKERANKSAKGHNGVRNIMEVLQIKDFRRICIGVGKQQPLHHYVLDFHNPDQKHYIQKVYSEIQQKLDLL